MVSDNPSETIPEKQPVEAVTDDWAYALLVGMIALAVGSLCVVVFLNLLRTVGA